MTEAFYAIFGAAVTTVSALACGLIVFRLLGLVLRRMEHLVLAYFTGAACLSWLVFGLAALQVARKGVFLALALGLVFAAYRQGRPEFAKSGGVRIPRRLALFSSVAMAPFFLLYLFTAWAPEVSYDGSTYHLGNVLRYWAHHGLVPIHDMYGALPQGLEMLFLDAFSIGRHPAAALVHFSFLIALPVAIVAFALRFGIPKAGFLAAVLVFASPVIGQDGTAAYNDVALAAAAFGVFYVLELWREEKNWRLLMVAGVLAGFCFGIKYTGFVAAVYGAIQIFAVAVGERRLKWRPILAFALPCALMVLPWLVKNTVYMQNPVSPFFNRLFPNPYVSTHFEAEYRARMANFAGTRNPRELALKYTFTGADVGGVMGPLFLLAPLGLICLGNPRGRRVLLAAALFGFPVLNNGGTRFLIPAAPLLALAIGIAVAETRFAVPALIAIHALASWPIFAKGYGSGVTWQFQVAPVFDQDAARNYMAEHLGDAWRMAKVVDENTPPGSRIFCISYPPQAYSLRDYEVYYQSRENGVMLDAMWTPMERWRQPVKRVMVSFPQVMARRLRVTLLQTRPGQVWKVTEMRILDGGREIPRASAWKIHASPDPWEAPFAFDNNPVSKWSCDEDGAHEPYLEVTFDQPIAADAVVLEGAADEPVELAVGAEISPGALTPLKTSMRSIDVEPPTGMRRSAIDLLKSYGYQYFVLSNQDYYADDYSKYARFWGIECIAEAGSWRLYRLE
jgi:hypothetical protein